MDKLPQTIMKPLLTGLIAGIGGSFVFGYSLTSDTVRLFNMPVNTALAFGLSTAAGSYLGAVSGNYLLPMIPNNSWVNSESMLVQPALSGLGTMAVMWAGGEIDTSVSAGFIKSFALGWNIIKLLNV